MDPVLVPAVSAIIAEPVKLIINTWLKPKLEEYTKKRKIDKLFFEDIENVFAEYLNRTYKQHQIVNLLAIKLQQVQIDQIYVPLNIFSNEKNETYKIDSFNLDFARRYNKIVIEDSAGMGKSTILKKLFISSIEKNAGIPVFIELRNLNSEKDIVEEIIENFNPMSGKRFDEDFIRQLISRGDFIFFLDGYDEIAFQYKEKVTDQLLKFISKADANIYFLSSRYEEAIASFGQFQKFQIRSLSQSEAFQLFEKYDVLTCYKIAPALIKQVKENINNYNELKSFLGNPLLVSLLYLTFRYKQDIPSSKNEFYRKVYDALYEDHDLTKSGFKRNKHSNLSSADLHKVLMKLGFLCLRENENNYSKDKLLNLIRDAKSSPYYNHINVDVIFNDITETVPLITCEGLDYKWTHKSFMEYFSALYIDSLDRKETVLNQIYKSDKFMIYLNMLDFYYDINRPMFDKVFIYPILVDYISYMEQMVGSFNKSTQNLEYYQYIYNHMLFLSEEFYDISESNKEFELIQKIKLDFPTIDEYQLSFVAVASRAEATYVFTKNRKIEQLLRLLYLRNNRAIKLLEKSNYEGISFKEQIITFERKSEDSLITKIGEYISNELGQSNDEIEFSSILYFDYFESKKYLELIQEMIRKREEDLLLEV